MSLPKITFGIIVLNGEPFTRYNLRALYPFAHQIIVVEGTSPKAAHAALSNGHSVDGTLEILRTFKANEDPEDKITIVTAEDDGKPDGFWPGEKDQQSQAYAKRATGDWLWQIDIDEFYQPDDMQRICRYLTDHPEMTCLTFNAYHFWGGFDYIVNGGLIISVRFLGEPWGACRRVFKLGKGYSYVKHRPPTIADASGKDITRQRIRCASKIFKEPSIRMYHYFMVFPEQFIRKAIFYDNEGWKHTRNLRQKYQDRLSQINWANGFRVLDQHDTRNWLERFTGNHPPQIQELRSDINAGNIKVRLRRTDDIESLLQTPRYRRRTQILWYLERIRSVYTYLVWRSRKCIAWFVRRFTPSWVVDCMPTSIQARFRKR